MGVFGEITTSHDLQRAGRYRWQGVKRFMVLNSATEAMHNTLWNSILAGYYGPFAPRCRRITSQRNVVPGVSLFTAYFKTVRQPGLAIVSGHAYTVSEGVRADLDGKPLEGLDYDTWSQKGTTLWYRLRSGEARREWPRGLFKIHCAYKSLKDANLLNRVGHVNSGSMSKISAKTGTMLLLKAPFTTWWQEDDLWYVDWTFAYEPRGWNSLTTTQQHTRVAVDIPTMDADGTIDDTITRRVPHYVPKVKSGKNWIDTAIEARRMFSKVSFSDISNQIWTPAA